MIFRFCDSSLENALTTHLQLQESLDYWSTFWRGLRDANEWVRQNHMGQRRPVYELYTIPKVKSWTADIRGRDIRRPRMRQYVKQAKRMVPYHQIPSQTDPVRLRRADRDIISGENPVMSALDPLGFRFRKTLGQGGGGIAILVDLLDENGQTDQWVVKLPVGRSSLAREARNMRVG